MVQDLSKKEKKKEKKEDKKEKGDKKEKKKDKKALFDDDEGKEEEPARAAPQASQPAVLPLHSAEEKKKDKKDKKEKEQKEREKKDKKDKKDKKEKRGGKEEQESAPAGKKAKRSEDIEAADFWKEIEDGIDARQGQLGGTAALSAAVGNADVHLAEAEAARLATQAELEEVKRRAAEAEAEVAAARKKAEDLVAAEATAVANAEAEAARLKAAAEAAEAAAAALGPPDETAAAALQAEEEAFEVDLDRPRSLSLTADESQLLQTEEGRWLERAKRMSPFATITLVEGAAGAWEAQISGDIPGAARRAELSLRGMLGALTTAAVELRVLPEADSENLELLDIPEGAAGAVQPQKLVDTWEVIAAFIRQKEPIKPRPHASEVQVELGKMLGLAVGQAVEVRYESEWYHGTAVGFSDDGAVQVEWFGGGRAEMPAVDVRASKTKAPAQAAKQPPTHGILVLMGELRQRTGAKLQAMAAVDRRVVGHFAERNPPASTNSLFGFDVRLLQLPAGDMGACAKQCSKIAKASEALVEVLGRHALLAGEADERSRAEILLTRMVPQAGPFGDIQEVPEELLEHTSKVRVPASAVSSVSGPERCLLSRTEDDSGCLVFLLPLGTTVPPRGKGTGVVALGGGACHSGGTAVNAKYKGQWHAATVLGVSEELGKVRVQWDYDGSEEDVPAEDLRPSGASEKRRETWLGKPRVFVIVGPERARRSCAMQIMAASEAACPGLWTGCLQEGCSEVRDGSSEEEVIVGVEAAAHDGTPLELEWLRSPAGQQAVRGASVAAPCRLELIGNAIFCAGYPDQRTLGRTYLQWALLSRHRISGAGGERAGGALSVVDADMREDITISFLSEAQAVWLRQERLWAIERETETMLVFDNGGGSALAIGQRRLLICGWSEEKRESARLRVEAIGTSGASSLSSALAAAADKSGEGTRPADAEVGAPDAKKLKADMSDPRAVLKTITWPATINAWGTLQKKIWAGHPKLASGWIRVWSRSQDSEYYLRLKDMTTTFDINDVLA